VERLHSLVRRNWRTTLATLAVVTDSAIVTFSFLLASSVTHPQPTIAEILTSHYRLLGFSILVFLAFFTSLGIYRTVSYSSFGHQASRAARGFVYGVGAILSALFLTRNLYYSREFLLLFFSLLPLAYALTWASLRMVLQLLQKEGFGQWNTLAIGSEPYLHQLLKRVNEFPELGYNVVGTIETSAKNNGDGFLHVDPEPVRELVNQKRVGMIVLSSSYLNGSFDDLEPLCKSRRIPIRVVSAESDYLFSAVGLRDIAGIPLFTPERQRIDVAKRLAKRLFDIVIASMILIAFSPVFLLVAIATKLESHGPVFFRQKRALTDEGKGFDFYKFRSMVHEADEKKSTLLHRNETNGALFKMRNDPRLTKVGKILRRFSIDELPQLINVIRGEMSLVGPRPLPIKDFRRLQEEDHMGGYYQHRARTKPGMTGLWQISGRSDLGFREMVLLDLYYVENQSLLFDLEILAQTVPVVLFGKGAY
jgi:exopolysaccharide biosynthesis polyprenyl glycosylphosphotransferase